MFSRVARARATVSSTFVGAATGLLERDVRLLDVWFRATFGTAVEALAGRGPLHLRPQGSGRPGRTLSFNRNGFPAI